MSTSTPGRDDDAPDLVCQLDAVHGMVEALSSARWKRHQVRRSVPPPPSPLAAPNPDPPFSEPKDAVMELSEHGVVITVEESGCLQAKVFLKREVAHARSARPSPVCVYASPSLTRSCRRSCSWSTSTRPRGGCASASAWGFSSTVSTHSRRRATRPPYTSGTPVPTCSFYSSMDIPMVVVPFLGLIRSTQDFC
jgi:hypothetical protein